MLERLAKAMQRRKSGAGIRMTGGLIARIVRLIESCECEANAGFETAGGQRRRAIREQLIRGT